MNNLPNSFWGWVFFLIAKYGSVFLQGCKVTLLLSLTGTFIGCVIGLLVGVVRTIPQPNKQSNIAVKFLYSLVQFLLLAYIEIFRGTPMMVQAMVLYYGSKQMFGFDMSPMVAGFVIVSINTGAYMAETVRGGIESIDTGQTEAAKAIGMTHWQTMVNIIIPQTVRNILPQIGNNLIANIKDTSVLNVISVTELFYSAQSVGGIYYNFFPTFFVASILYFVMTFVCARLLRWFEHRIDGPGFYTLVDPMADPTNAVSAKKYRKGGLHIWLK